jgi:hypothetical protein
MHYQICNDPILFVSIEITPHWIGLDITDSQHEGEVRPRFSFARYDGIWYSIANRTLVEIKKGRAARLNEIYDIEEFPYSALIKWLADDARLVRLYNQLERNPIWNVIKHDAENLFLIQHIMDC